MKVNFTSVINFPILKNEKIENKKSMKTQKIIKNILKVLQSVKSTLTSHQKSIQNCKCSLQKLQKQPQEVLCKNRPASLLKKRLWHWCFPMKFVKLLRTPFLTEHLWVTASEVNTSWPWLQNFCEEKFCTRRHLLGRKNIPTFTRLKELFIAKLHFAYKFVMFNSSAFMELQWNWDFLNLP